MSRTKSFISGLVSTTAQKLLTKLIGLAVTPIVLSYLGPSEYGIWIVIGSLLGYMGLMDLGVTGATTVLASQKNNAKEEDKINIIINNSFFVQVVLAVILLVIGFIAAYFFPSYINLGSYPKDNAILVFLIAVLAYSIGLPSKSLKGIIRARQHISLVAFLEFSVFLTTTALTILLLNYQMGLFALPLGTIIVRFLSFPIFIYFTKKSYPLLKWDLTLVQKTHIKSIMGVSIYWFIGMIAAMVIYSTDVLLIGMFLSTALVTSYALNHRLAEVTRDFLFSFYFTMMPALGQLLGKGEKSKVKLLYLKTQGVILCLAITLATGIFLFNEKFVSFWVGNELYFGETLTLIFSLILLCSIVFQSSSVVLNAGLYVNFVTKVRFFEAILNILISLILIKDYGLEGLAMATLLASLLTSFWVIPYKTIKYLNISLGEWVSNVLSKVVLLAILNIVIVFFSYSVDLLLLIFAFLILNGLAIWQFVLDKEIKSQITRKLVALKLF